MSTPALRPQKSRLARRALWAFAIGFSLIVITGGGTALWFRSVANAALPQLDGTIQVPGLRQPVSVIRDAQGVPYIQASNLEDLFFAQGFVTAQDRLWQMDLSRRYATGELSELFGKLTVAVDKEQRLLQLRRVAGRATAALSADERSRMEAYARGVNASIEHSKENLPAEFRVLGYEPRPWTVEDSFLIALSISEMLNHGFYETELTREKILAKVGPEMTADLYINESHRERVPGSAAAAKEGVPALKADSRTDGRTAAPSRWASSLTLSEFPEEALAPGSNNWVISGAHTTTSKPLLSNDMHLPHQIPNIWYEAHLTSGDFDVVGFTLPGLPYVVVGHNQYVAWGATSLNPDVEDVFIEQFNDKGEYLTPTGWQKPERHQETIKVAFGGDVTIDVVTTRNGPIISSLFEEEKRQLALRWVVYDPQPLQIPLFDVNRARDWQSFRDAFSRFPGPGLSLVYADVEGHIGFQVTGRVPIRRAGDGSLPVPGHDDTHAWAGYIPYDELPSIFDPTSGIIASANSRVSPDGYKHSITTQWIAPYRTERIYNVLESGKKFSSADLLALQTDVYSAYDLLWAKRLARAVHKNAQASPRARDAAQLLSAWDGFLTIDSAAATIGSVARRRFIELTLNEKLGEELAADYSWFMSSVAWEKILNDEPARWLPKDFHSYDEALAAALEYAVNDEAKLTSTRKMKAPDRLEDWQWGKTFPLEIQHPLFGAVPLLKKYAGPGLAPQSGGSQSVKQVGRGFGPSERMTVDLADLDRSTFNIVTGQSGNIFSPHYMDQWKAWYDGATFTMQFSAEAVKRAQAHRLELQPK